MKNFKKETKKSTGVKKDFQPKQANSHYVALELDLVTLYLSRLIPLVLLLIVEIIFFCAVDSWRQLDA